MKLDASALVASIGADSWAECHGSMAGALVAGLSVEQAVEVAAQSHSGIDPARLRPWADNLSQALAGLDLDFVLQIPADNTPLESRSAALAAWVRGFLSAVGLGGSKLDSVGNDGREALSDLAVIAQGASVTQEGSEAEEEALAQLMEYIRLVVQFLFESLNPSPPSSRGKMKL